MSLFLRKFPFNDEIVILSGKNKGYATDELQKWTESIERQASASPVAPNPAVQELAISGSTSGNLGGSLPAGLYTVKAYREVITADPVSGSLGIELNWTHNGKALTRVLPAFGGAPQTPADNRGDVEFLEIDPNTTIGYDLVYASNTPGVSVFQVDLIAQLDQTVS